MEKTDYPSNDRNISSPSENLTKGNKSIVWIVYLLYFFSLFFVSDRLSNAIIHVLGPMPGIMVAIDQFFEYKGTTETISFPFFLKLINLFMTVPGSVSLIIYVHIKKGVSWPLAKLMCFHSAVLGAWYLLGFWSVAKLAFNV